MVGTLQQFMKDMKAGVYDFTNDGKCVGCGECCSNILPLSKNDIARITKYIKYHGIKECKHFVPTTNKIFDMTCPFRDNEKKICTIYPARPAICKNFKCDKAAKGVMEVENLLNDDYEIVLVSEMFFGR